MVMPALNLLSTARKMRIVRRRRLVSWQRWGGAYAGLLVVVCAAAASTGKSDLSEARASLSTQELRNEARKTEIQDLQKQVAGAQRALRAIQAVREQPDWSILVSIISDLTPAEVSLQRIRVEPIAPSAPATARGAAKPASGKGLTEPDQFKIHLEGFALKQEHATALAISLENSMVFDEVKLISSKREAFRDADAVRFNIECIILGGESE
jgi:hypothetical protein